MPDYNIKEGDRLPALEVTLLDGEGAAVDLTGAVSATLYRRNASGTVTSYAMSFNADRTTGKVSYGWGAGETDTAGVYECEVKVTWSGSREETFPAIGTFKIQIRADLET